MTKEQIINVIELVQKHIDKQYEINAKYEIIRIEQSENGKVWVYVNFVCDNGLDTCKRSRCFQILDNGEVR